MNWEKSRTPIEIWDTHEYGQDTHELGEIQDTHGLILCMSQYSPRNLWVSQITLPKFMGVPNYPPKSRETMRRQGDTLSDWMPGQARHDDRGARRHSYRNYPLSQIAWADKFGGQIWDTHELGEIQDTHGLILCMSQYSPRNLWVSQITRNLWVSQITAMNWTRQKACHQI